MVSLEKLVLDHVRTLVPYSSARTEYDGHGDIFLDANENPYDFEYARYPDPLQKKLKKLIGEWRNISTENIFLGNGSDEIIDLLMRSTCISGKDKILSLNPSYGMYFVLARINNIHLDTFEFDRDFSIDEKRLLTEVAQNKHKIIFLCSPNNPDGGVIPIELIKSVLKISNGIVVVDEAYIDFSDRQSLITVLDQFSHLVILQTMSKAFGAAGLRVGMGFMNPYLVGVLNKIKPPYNISSASQNEAIKQFSKITTIEEAIEKIRIQRDRLTSYFNKSDLVEKVYDSEANFLLVRFYNHQVILKTLKEHNIIVRDRSSIINCDGCLRVSIGTKEEVDVLCRVLDNLN